MSEAAARTKLNDCLTTGDMLPFYRTTAWRNVRREVLRLDHHECQGCAKRGRHTRATYVHHVNQLKARPDLALEVWYEDKHGRKQRNLISLCYACHEREHGYRQGGLQKEPVTPERW